MKFTYSLILSLLTTASVSLATENQPLTQKAKSAIDQAILADSFFDNDMTLSIVEEVTTYKLRTDIDTEPMIYSVKGAVSAKHYEVENVQYFNFVCQVGIDPLRGDDASASCQFENSDY